MAIINIHDFEKSVTNILNGNGSKEDFENIERCKVFFPSISVFINAILSYYQKRNYLEASQYITTTIELLQSPSETSFEQFLNRNWINRVYLLAGEIYANNNQVEKALDAFQYYQVHILRIKSWDDDNCLLSFRNYNQYTLSDLINEEITVCSPKVMNDPYDTLLLKWGEYLNKTQNDVKHTRYFCESLNLYRIRSFTKVRNKDNNNDMISNILMWSHYAGQHEGFCIEYSFSKDFINVTKNERTIRLKDIIYKNEKIDLTNENMNTNICLRYKHCDWDYENEVRLIVYDINHKEDFYQIPLGSSKIKSIYFGYRCPKKHIDTIKHILSGKDIQYYKMESDYTDILRLTPKPI